MPACHPARDWSNSRQFIHGRGGGGGKRWGSRREGNQNHVLVCSSKEACTPPMFVLVSAQLVMKDGIAGFCGC